MPRWCISKNPGETRNGNMPFGRLWQDEALRTVNTRMWDPCLACLHPSQPRVLSIRELARAQVIHLKLVDCRSNAGSETWHTE